MTLLSMIAASIQRSIEGPIVATLRNGETTGAADFFWLNDGRFFCGRIPPLILGCQFDRFADVKGAESDLMATKS